MIALSVRQPFTELTARGEKTVEYRPWARNIHGDLLVVASKGRYDWECEKGGVDPRSVVYGQTLCVVEVVRIDGQHGDYDWHLRNPRRVESLPYKGPASLYHVPDGLIRLAANPPRSGARLKAKRSDETAKRSAQAG